jgi:ubiquinone/menaquinone biosynthesis C-methylase UbiE
MKKQTIEKKDIKNYWENKSPQTWYSDKDQDNNSTSWFNELAYKRYNVYYEYLKDIAEFNYHKEEKVLEVGTGVGTDIVSYAKNGSKVSGVDLTEKAIEITKKHLETFKLPYEKLLVADAENLPFEDNYFDLVYSFGVLHHTPNTEQGVQEVLRVLKPGGKFIIMLYSKGWKHYFKRLFIFGLLKGYLFKYGYEKTVNKTTEVQGNSPLTYVLKIKDIKKIFRDAEDVNIKKYRLGEFFDYAPYNTKKLPNFITNFFYFFGLERLIGENYIIKGFKKNPDKKKSNNKISVWQVIWDEYKNYK